MPGSMQLVVLCWISSYKTGVIKRTTPADARETVNQ
jgi:hypothetical protein